MELKSFFVNQGDTQLVQQVLDDVQREYYRPVSRSSLVNKGLAAAIASLNDPYSHYFSPTEYHSFQNESNPHLSGIGVDVIPDPLGLRIVDVFPGSPAARAGLGTGGSDPVGRVEVARGTVGRLRVEPDPRPSGDEGDANDPFGA